MEKYLDYILTVRRTGDLIPTINGVNSKTGEFNHQYLWDIAYNLPQIQQNQLQGRDKFVSFGTSLYNALLEPVKGSFEHETWKNLKENIRLRLRIVFEEGAKPADLGTKLITIPWEFLYYPEDKTFLGTDSHVALSCSYQSWLNEQMDGCAVTDLPLRMLFVHAHPEDLQPVGFPEQVKEELAGLHDTVEITELPNPSFDALREALERKPHIFHFLGHGTAGKLAFRDEQQGDALWYAGHSLSDLLRGREVKVIVLQACEGAAPEEMTQFSSTAAGFVEQGVPAVLAFRYPINQVSAWNFVSTFYAKLAQGQPLDAAVQAGREMLSGGPEGHASRDFGSPVLWSRLKEGRLFSVKEEIVPFETKDQGNQVSDHRHAERPSSEIEQLQRLYLRWLLREIGYVPLTSIVPKNVASKVETSLNLHAIYTALLTSESEHEEESRQSRLTDPGKERRLSALAQLNRHRRFVLLGDPGSGKSTFVNFVVMCLAGELLDDPAANHRLLTNPLPNDKGESGEERQPWDHDPVLPVRVILRDFASRGLPADGKSAKAKHLLEFIEQELEKETPWEFAPYLKEHLQNHGGLLVLDGLDEVPEPDWQRPQIKQAVEEFADLFPLCRIVVTSRTYAYRETDQETDQKKEWKLGNFAEATLSLFTTGQIRCFVTRWYKYMAPLLGLHHDAAMQQADNLQTTIFNNDRLRELAERPLLLTQMAILHATWQGKLPQKRVELYKETVDLLLDRWDRGKFKAGNMSYPSLSAWLDVDQDRILGLLSELAFEAHARQAKTENNTADIPLGKLASGLLTISPKQMQHAFLIEHLCDRAGLLVLSSTKEDAYAFPHRSFQEYLAARHLTDAPDYPTNMTRLARQDLNRWREVVLLAGAKSAIGIGQSIWTLADALCYQNVQDVRATSEDARVTMLAGQALAETANLTQVDPYNHPKLERIQEWLIAILTEKTPPDKPLPAIERANAGNILAQLGDSRPGVGLHEDGLPDIKWCEVPKGKFTMGSNDYDDEKPPHPVTLRTYRISRYPITNAQYQAFVEDGGYSEKKYWTKEGLEWKEEDNVSGPGRQGGVFDLPNHPMVMVSWYEAMAFCEWLTICLREKGELSDNQVVRIPSEAEWEKAARGTDGRTYPWSEGIDPERANYIETNLGATSTVGCFPRGANPEYGCEDMAGNVWEWCADPWHKNYEDAPQDGSGWEKAGDARYRLLRGGSWGYNPVGLRCADRNLYGPDNRDEYIGFRVVCVSGARTLL